LTKIRHGCHEIYPERHKALPMSALGKGYLGHVLREEMRYPPAVLLSSLYAIAGIVWVITTRKLLAYLVTDPQRLAELSVYKELLWVAASTAVIYYVAHRFETRRAGSLPKPNPPYEEAWSLGSRLYLLVAAVGLPLGLLIGYLIYQQARVDARSAQRAVETIAQVVASNTRQILNEESEKLSLIAKRPQVVAMNSEQCDPALNYFSQIVPASTVMLWNPKGMSICPGPKSGRRFSDVLDSSWFQRALHEPQPVLSDPYIEPVTGKWIAVLAYTVKDGGGNPVGILAFSLDLNRFAPVADPVVREVDALRLFDGQGRLVIDSVDERSKLWRGEADGAVSKVALQRRTGHALSSGRDRVERIYGFAPIAGTDWFVLAGVSIDRVFANADQVLIRSALLATMTLLLVWLAALRIGRTIEEPIGAIALTINAVAAGDWDARVALQGPKEVRALAWYFNAMLASRRQAVQDRERLLARVTDGFVAVDRDWRITFVNRSAGELLQQAPDALVGQDLWAKFPEAATQPFHDASIQALADQKPGHAENYSAQFDHWFETRIYPGSDGLSIFIRDITKAKQTEAEIQKLHNSLEQQVAERTRELQTANEALEAFSYSISHDLRAPLRAMHGFTSLALEEMGAHEGDAKVLLARAREAATRMSEMIDAMLTLAQVSRAPVDRQQVDLEQLGRTIMAELDARAEGREVHFAVDLQCSPLVHGDPVLLRIMLTNLLENAWKYTAQKEVAHIQFGGASQPDEGRVFWVRDNGAGFDMAYAGELFTTEFVRLHSSSEFPGHGIGLATAARIVSRHGGRIWAEAKPGEGACFFFSLDSSPSTSPNSWRR
jgi:PAS domain S-box-containing protein